MFPRYSGPVDNGHRLGNTFVFLRLHGLTQLWLTVLQSAELICNSEDWKNVQSDQKRGETHPQFLTGLHAYQRNTVLWVVLLWPQQVLLVFRVHLLRREIKLRFRALFEILQIDLQEVGSRQDFQGV
jgi:hypothetical protein